jgi:hypothetical protein
MTAMLRRLMVLLGLVLVAQSWIASAADADNRLQIYGLTLDETRLGDGFCEKKTPADFVTHACAQSRQSLPKIAVIDVQTTPAPHVMLTLAPAPGARPRDVRIWYSPREQGGRSFMITTITDSPRNLDGARGEVLEAFGMPAVEFSHADMEARGIHVDDLTIDTLLYVDRDLPPADWNRIAHRLRTNFDPTGSQLFGLANSNLRTLSRLLGPDFRGAIVQISESGWSHESSVTTILLDLKRAQSIFDLSG